MESAARHPWAMSLVAATAIVCGRPSISAACSPAFGISSREVLPPDGAVDVPLNAEVTVSYDGDVGDLDYPVVRPSGGELVEVTTDPTPAGWHLDVVLKPVAVLAPDTTYEVLDRLEFPCLDAVEACILPDYQVISTFTTGADLDDSAPSFAGLAGLDSAFQPEVDNDSCGVYSYVYFTLDWGVAEDDGPQQWVRYHVYDAQDRLRSARHPGTSAYGAALCSGQPDFWPHFSDFAGPIGGYYVRAVDVAGNEDDNRVVLQTIGCGAPTIDAGPVPDAAADAASGGLADGDEGGCGCTVGHAARGRPLPVLLSFVVVLVRRRSR